MSSHELSLPKSISVWSWPDTNLVLRRPKDLIHVETTKTSHIKNSGWKERTSRCRNLTQISLCFKCEGSGNGEGSVSLAMCQAPAAGPEEKVDPPPLCGFYPCGFNSHLKYRFLSRASQIPLHSKSRTGSFSLHLSQL